jgi:peptide/nickel transport system substrate-binding protein
MKNSVFCLAALGLGLFLLPVSSHAASPEGTLQVAVSTDLVGLEPVVEHTTTGLMMNRHIYDSLLSFGPKGEILPRLAEKWELLDDKSWRFHLRKGVKFHNGYPFTAADVKFSMDYHLDPKNKWNYKGIFSNLDSVEVADEYTVLFKSKQADPMLPAQLAAWMRIASKKLYDELGSEGFGKTAVGTGPYKFVEWKRKDRLILEANPQSYQVSPKVKTLVFRVIPEMGARVAELQAGGVDIMIDVPPFMVPQLTKTDAIRVHSVPSLRAFYLLLDTTKVEALKDKRVRQALNYAVDKNAIIQGMLNGMGEVLTSHVPVVVNGVDPSIKPYPYDPEKAKTLLKEAGYAQGLTLNLYTPQGRYPMDKEVTLAVADQLTKVGIQAKLNVLETGAYFRGLTGHTLEGGLYYLGMASSEWDVNHALNNLDSAFVLCFYPNEDINTMVREAKVTMDTKKRYEMASKIQKIVHEDAPYLFLFDSTVSFAVSNKVQGFVARADEYMDLWEVSLRK